MRRFGFPEGLSESREKGLDGLRGVPFSSGTARRLGMVIVAEGWNICRRAFLTRFFAGFRNPIGVNMRRRRVAECMVTYNCFRNQIGLDRRAGERVWFCPIAPGPWKYYGQARDQQRWGAKPDARIEARHQSRRTRQ